MLDSAISSQSNSGKYIKVTPESLTFDQLAPGGDQQLELTLRNNFSSPVDINLKAGEGSKIQIEPKTKRLAPFETIVALVTARLSKSVKAGGLKPVQYKEQIKIESDFFDQIVKVTLIPQTVQHHSSVESGRSRSNNAIQSRGVSKSPERLEEAVIKELTLKIKSAEEEIVSLKSQLQMQNDNEDYLNQVRALLRDREPKLEQLMEITLRKERVEQEKKDAVVLELLKIKDRQIEDLQASASGLQAEAEKLSEAFEECKKRNSELEQRDHQLTAATKQLEVKLEAANSKVEKLMSGKEYKRLIEQEERLKEVSQYLESLQEGLNASQIAIQKKENIEVYLQEVVARLKDQVTEKDAKIQELARDLSSEREGRIRADQQAKTFQEQLRHQSAGLVQSDAFERVNKLQDEKTELLREVEVRRREALALEDQVRDLIDIITDVRSSSRLALSSSPIRQSKPLETLGRRIQDLIAGLQGLAEENKTLQSARASLDASIKAQEERLEEAISDNRKLSAQIHGLVSRKTLSRPVQTEIEGDDMEIFEEMRDKSSGLEDRLEALTLKLKERDRSIAHLQAELEFKSQEVSLIGKPSGAPDDQIVTRLNAKVSQLQQNEDILLQELSRLRQGSSHIETESRSQPLQEKFEAIVTEQGAKLLKLEEENSSLRRQIREITQQARNYAEAASLRLKNVQDLNRKYEMLSSQKEVSASPIEAERMRQALQQLEIANLTLLQQNEELRADLQHLVSDAKQAKEEVEASESLLLRQRYDCQLHHTGLQSQSDSKVHLKAAELKKQVKFLQGLLIRAKKDFDHLQASKVPQVEGSEKLRKEHAQALMAVVDMREEFAGKLEAITEKHDSERQKLLKENAALARRVDSLQTQMTYMEKKETKLFGQLEEARELQASESQANDLRLKELEGLLFKKEASIMDLEREVRTKEKTLMERQEQIAVLIATLEGDQGRDELKQKVVNLSAELCSVKAIESQQVKKLTELTHHLKQMELQIQKGQRQADQLRVEVRDLEKALALAAIEIRQLQSRLSDMDQGLEERDRELSELRYRLERDEFALSLKQESVAQSREQLKKIETSFKEEIERLTKQLFEQVSKSYERLPRNLEGHFKTQLQQIHVMLADILASQEAHEEKALFDEFEKALHVASGTIEKLQEELDKAQFVGLHFKQDLKGLVVSKVIAQRFESLITSQETLKVKVAQREGERAKLFQDQQNSLKKVVREQELRLAHYETEASKVEEEARLLREELRIVRDQRDELEANLLLFDSEQKSKLSAAEKRAEMTVDERYKSKHEAIKCYFDSTITKILLGSNIGSDKVIELGREILGLKLVSQKLEGQLLVEQSESKALAITLAHYKEQHSHLEQKIRDLTSKNAQVSLRSYKSSISVRMENERKKHEVVALEKELIKLRDEVESKTRVQDMQPEALDNAKELMENANLEHTVKIQSQTIADLQERLLEISSAHIQELDGLRVSYQSDLAEAKAQLARERDLLEKRYMPGHAPGEIKEENMELVRRIQELKRNLETVMQEGAQARKKLDSERQINDVLRREIESYKQALVELEATMTEMSPKREDSNSRQEEKKKSKKQKKRDDLSSLSILTQDLEQQFGVNPPSIVRALIQSKLRELGIQKRLDEALQTEIRLRQELKEAKGAGSAVLAPINEAAMISKIMDLEAEIEELRLQRVRDEADALVRPVPEDKCNSASDFALMTRTVIALVQQLASGESQAVSCVEEVQRAVIKQLLKKLHPSDLDTLQAPSDAEDRKLWYLELLEQQVAGADQVLASLQAFIKKLQIDIQGNMHSAAAIKAASMDLTAQLSRTAEEVKALKHAVALAKHDLSLGPMAERTVNPFVTGQLPQTFNQMMGQVDELQNQLTITEKVRKSLEEEIIALRVQHQQQLAQAGARLEEANEQRNSVLQGNEDLHDRVDMLQSQLEEMRTASRQLEQDHAQAQSLLMEKERDRQVLAQNKASTGKHLQKLQADMQDWRRQTDENLKLKEAQVADLQNQLATLQKEKERLKSENQMLRRVDKDRRAGETEDIKRLEELNQELQEKLESQLDERKREIEYWVSERATMREMIEQLESEKVTVLPTDEEAVRLLKKKSQKKLKDKQLELDALARQAQDFRDQVHCSRQVQTQLEQRLREASENLREAEDHLKYLTQRSRELELERDLILAEKTNAINEHDVTAQQIQVELNSLRECFARLKIERDNLLLEIETTVSRESEWRQTVERLASEVQKLEGQISGREREQSQLLKQAEAKTQILVQDMKYLKSENERLKQKVQGLESQSFQFEQSLHNADIKRQEALFSSEELKKILSDSRELLKAKEAQIAELQQSLMEAERLKFREVEELRGKVEEVRDSNGHLVQLFQAQVLELRSRLVAKGKMEAQVDHIVTLAQREAVLKSLKKELTATKSALAKSKAKNKELKIQLTGAEKENVSSNYSGSTKQSTSRKTLRSNRSEEEAVDRSVLKVAQALMAPGEQPLDCVRRLGQLAGKLLELEALVEKLRTVDVINQNQLGNMKAANQELAEQLDELSERLAHVQKEARAAGSSKQLQDLLETTKSQLRQAQLEVQTLKQEWVPPSEAKSLQERVKESQATIKALRDEVQRKKDVITSLKSSKEQTESDAKEAVADLEGLKDDNAKLQRLIKENAKQVGMVKELKTANDQLRAAERRLREEIVQANDRAKAARAETQRKEAFARELKEKLDLLQDDCQQTRDLLGEIDRLKDQIKKHKLEIEIKENQVRSLKVKLEHSEGLKSSQRPETEELEAQLKKAQSKFKKCEGVLKKSLEALRKIGKEVIGTHQNSSRRTSAFPTASKPHFQSVKEEDPGLKQFYKDSVNILGMSIDELMDDFVAPQQPASHQMSLVHSSNPAAKGWEQQLQANIDRLNAVASEDNAHLTDAVDQVCQLCLKLIGEINSSVAASGVQSPTAAIRK